MASNDQWPPVTSSSLGKGQGGRKNDKNKNNNSNNNKNKNQQQMVSDLVTEMFQSTLEHDVILSIAENCNWDLQLTIDSLITLSATVEDKKKQANKSVMSATGLSLDNQTNLSADSTGPDKFLQMNDNELKQQLEGFNKFEQLKKNSSKNKMDSFRGKITKVDTQKATTAAANKSPVKVEGKPIPSSPWKKPTKSWTSVGDLKKKDDSRVWQSNSNYLSTNFFTTNTPSPSSQNDYFHQVSSNAHRNQNQKKINKTNNNSNNKKINNNNKNLLNKRTESELCGLKVHYRQSGIESSSEDDDADVVIEEEYNDYDSTSNIPVNVSQFLSSPVQSSLQSNTQPAAIKPVSVKSPSIDPQNLHEITIEKIKIAISHGDKIIVLMRGLPGSGKSKIAKNLISTTLAKDPSIYIYSTDDFFQLHNRGVYKYDPTKLHEAHSENHRRVLNAMKSGKTPIIVDNTNLQIWEMRPYVMMAINNGYAIEVLETNTPWAYNINELTRKNTHGVSKEKIRFMLKKYERGITGQKLLDIYSLKNTSSFNPIITTPTQSPTINSIKNKIIVENKITDQRIEDNKIIQDNKNSFSKYLQSLALPEVLPEVNEVSKINIEEIEKEKTNGVKPDDGQTLQPLGAIGSERKNSVVHLDLISPVRETDEIEREIKDNSNILPPCWDFTLLLDGKTLHSNHLEEEYFYNKSKGSPVDADEIRKQDEEFSKEGNSGKVSPLLTEDETFQEFEKSSDEMDEFIKELRREFNENGRFDTKESTVIITEIVDDDELVQLSDNADSSDEINKDYVDAVINNESEDGDKEQDDDNSDDEEELHTSDEDVIGHGEFKVKIPWPEVDDIDIDSEFLDDSVDDTVGDESLSDDDAREALEKTDIAEKAESKVPEVKNEEKIEEMTKFPVKSTIGSIFNIIKTSILGENSVEEITADNNLEKKIKSLEDDKKEKVEEKSDLSDLQLNNKIETTPEIVEILTQDTKELIKENLDVSINIEEDKVDNINSITWKESPFPLNNVPSTKLILDEISDKKIISTNDIGTNTSKYDLNISFVGKTDDLNYRFIKVFRRSINEGMPLVKSERPPLKLMLDKSTMTGDMFERDIELQRDNPLSNSYFIGQLKYLFPNVPHDYWIDKYGNSYDRALSLKVDVLPDSNTDNIPIDMLDNIESKEVIEVQQEDKKDQVSSLLTESSVKFLNEIEVKTIEENLQKISLNEDLNKEEKKEASISSMEEDENEEFRLQETESIQDNKTDTNISDDISSHSTVSTSRTDSIENEKSSELEETVELNLGFDGICGLEKLFSNSDFLIPDGFKPIIKVKKSMAKELYALWIESMYQQLNSRHEHLDNMIAKDAEYAKSLEKQLELEEICTSSNKISSDLQESINLELALKTYNEAVKKTIIKDLPDDMMFQLSRQILHKSLPDIDPTTLDEVFNAHGNNLKETFEIIKASTGKSIATDITKEETFVDKVKANNNNNNDEKQKSTSITPIIVVRPDLKNSPKNDKTKALLSIDNAKQESQRQFSLQIENFNKAAEAYRRGCPAVAAYYSQVSRQHAKYNKEAQADAASATVEAQILDNEDILDLHYLLVPDAIVALDTFLDYHLNKLIKSNKRYSIVFIVTGRGSRSINKMSRIKPAVEQNLINRNIRFSEANPGCLKVILHRKNGTD